MKTRPAILQNMEWYHAEGCGDRQEEIVTFQLSEEKRFDSFYDYSPRVKLSNSARAATRKPILKLFIRSSHLPADRETAADFDEQKEKIIRENEHQDNDYRFSQPYVVPELPRVMMINRSNPGRVSIPCCYSRTLYCLCIFLTMAFPWRCLLAWCCATERIYTSLKALSINELDEQKVRQVELEKGAQVAEF